MTFRRILVPAAIACIVVFGLLPIAEPYLRRLIVVARFANMPAPTFLIVPVEGASKQIKDSWGDPRSGSRTHKGVDIFSPQGAPVRSTTDGLILPVGTNRLGGNIVTVLGPGLCVHYYAHLDHFGVFDAGDIIKQGDILGCVGNTGNAKGTPSHLHYGIYMPGKGAIATYVAVFGYDGKSFTTIDDKSLGFNESTGRLHVRSVFEDSKGRLWIGNNGIGVILHDGHAFTQFSQENGLGKMGMHGGRATPQPGDVTNGSPTLHRVF